MFSKLTVLSVPLLLAPYAVKADIVSLYIPDTPAAAISADVLGVEGGVTTWRLSPGQPSGTLSSADFPAATLVEGPNEVHAFAQQDGIAGQIDCGIKDGVAVCTAVLSADGTTRTLPATTETVTGIPKNAASRVAGSSLGVVAVMMGVAYLIF
ncbi:hypothetical protein L226DRAFT_521655 [Lentinus tigrinus ALCF2SS1-7]|uniref:uncharacterized protein n=1 Tax=Lentinus tigrinus ALCF2SS1-7 TaxID=1328758 RepID=UPI0011660D57|nr:hypothetical protein L226DRAFT_521655 [Lentinus tigrinus ALCF2SS1-7]